MDFSVVYGSNPNQVQSHLPQRIPTIPHSKAGVPIHPSLCPNLGFEIERIIPTVG